MTIQQAFDTPEMFTATKIYVTTAPLNQSEKPEFNTFPVYQFENGAIMVLSESVPDWFFDCIDEFQPNGLDVVESWAVSDETEDFTEEDLKDWMQKSIDYYGHADGTAKILELLRG